MIVHQGVEAIAAAVPDVPDEGPVVEQLAVLLEEPVTQPIVEPLAGKTDLGQELGQAGRRPGRAEGGRQQLHQPIGRRRLALDRRQADDAVRIGKAE